jgi:fibronectin type 3 domain-containing protein
VLLRWAVDQPLAWKTANEVGFWIERATISRNGEAVVPIERKQLVSQPLKPKPLEDWEELANQDQSVAILAQALYGDSFEVSTPGNQMGQVFAINDELEQRFTFALVAAEQNFEASKLAGWAIEDETVMAGEKYVYSVSVATPGQSISNIKNGTVYASPDLFEALPKPIGLTGIFSDKKVGLSWNFNLLQNVYTNYQVERSKDNISFEKLNGVPLFSAQQPKDATEISLFYTDSIPNNTNFYYRVKGKTAFGETGPNSEVIQGMAEADLGFVPRIYQKQLPTDNKVILHWEFKEEGNKLIDKFELRKANTNKGPFSTVIDNIPIAARKITYEGLDRVNYFIIAAIGKNGVESESYASLVQPVDSIPPSPPSGLEGVVDTIGIVKLSWANNLEEDLGGYRIYRSYNPNNEFSEVTRATLIKTSYADTIAAANLNREIYYKILAEDQRYNRSQFSNVLTIEKPDNIPPSSPILNNYEVTTDGIILLWIPSSSVDVASHKVYRKKGSAQEALWEKLHESSSSNDSTFIDSTVEEPSVYSYTVVATDSTGLESLPSKPINIMWNDRNIKEEDIRFSGTVNRQLRFINLTWNVKDFNVLEYRLYKGKNDRNLRLYKTLNGTTRGYNDVDLEINSDYTYGLQIILHTGRTTLIKKFNIKY